VDTHRLTIKLFSDSALPDPRVFVPVFHNWIKESKTAETWIDVTDYSHVHHGPGILLVASDANYSVDAGSGKLGLLYDRKRNTQELPFPELLETSFRFATEAAHLIESEPTLAQFRFNTHQIFFGLRDRLNAPNNDNTLAAVTPHLNALFNRIAPGSNPRLQRSADDKAFFGVQIDLEQPRSIAELHQSLGSTHS